MRGSSCTLVVVGMLLICGCAQRQLAGTAGEPENKGASPLMELMKTIQQAEADAYTKEFHEMKGDVTDAAKRVFSRRKMKAFTRDQTDFGNAFHRVILREGVFIVTGHNYWWKLTPVVEDGQVKDLRVEASPICLW
jgi:hypothetical protein